jgi:hypothetical protein
MTGPLLLTLTYQALGMMTAVMPSFQMLEQ